MKTKLRSLRNESCSACRTREEEDAGRRDRGRDVAEHVDLGPARALRPVAQPQRHAAGLQRGAHRAPHVDDRGRLRRPRCSWPSVASRRFSCATARWTAARSWVGLVGSARSSSASGREGGSFCGALDQRPLELAAQVALERVDAVAVERRGSLARRAPRPRAGRSPSVRRIRCTSTPTTPEPSPLAAEGGDRQPRQVAHLAVVAVDDRLADRLAQLVEVEPLAALVAARSSLDARARSPRASAARKK